MQKNRSSTDLDSLSLSQRNDLCEDWQLAVDEFVDDDLDLRHLFVCHGALGGEIEAEVLGRNQRALLVRLRAQHHSQGEVEKMGGRVVIHCGPSSFLKYDTMKQ